MPKSPWTLDELETMLAANLERVRQLVQQLEQAVRAETLGYRGRYYCVSEAQLEALLKREGEA